MDLDLIKIRNTGDKPLVLRHDGKGDVSIAPGAERILLAEYAYLSFGHPNSRNEGRERARDTEYSNARTLWGFYPGLMPEAEWEELFKPAFECHDVQTGERVFTVLDDPDGSLAAAHAGTVTDAASDAVERAGYDAQIAALQAQISQLTNLVLIQQGVPAPAADVDSEVDPDEGNDSGSGDGGNSSDGEQDADNSAQAKRNAKRDEIPKPAADEPPVVSDKPKTTRVGRR